MRVLVAAAGDVLHRVFVEPVVEGRLRSREWPRGLVAIVLLALAAFGAAVVLVLAAATLRDHSTLELALGGDVTYPRWSLPVFLLLALLTLALLHAASLHLPTWLRVGGLLVPVIALVGLPLSPYGEGHSPHVVSWVGAGLLVVLTAVRWRAEFRWWEFVVSFLVVGATAALVLRLVAHIEAPVGLDATPTALTLTMQLVAALATPFVFAAGLAFAQLALLIAGRVAGVVDERVRRTWPVTLLVVVVAVVDVSLVVRHLTGPTATGATRLAESGSGLLLLAVAGVLAWLLVLRHPPAGPSAAEPSLDGLETSVAGLALPVGLLVTLTTIPTLLAARLHSQVVRWSGSDPLHLDDVRDVVSDLDTLTWTRVAVGVLLLGWAARQGNRRELPALIAVGVGVAVLMTETRRATGDRVDLAWTVDALNDASVTLAVAALVGLAAAHRLTRPRLVVLGTVLGVALAWSVRSTFDAPFVAVFGFGSTAAVFLGALWATLTGAAEVNEDSARFPRPARVLLFAANALLGMTVLAFLALTRAGGVGLDVSAYGTLGDLFLGTGLLLAAYVVLAGQIVRPPTPRCSPSS